MSITPVSGLKMREGGCEKGLLDPCAQDIPNNGDTVGGLRGVQREGECWLREELDGSGFDWVSGRFRPSEREGRPLPAHGVGLGWASPNERGSWQSPGDLRWAPGGPCRGGELRRPRRSMPGESGRRKLLTLLRPSDRFRFFLGGRRKSWARSPLDR